MRVAFVLRSLLQGRWPQLVAFTPLVLFVVVLGNPAVTPGIAVWIMGLAGWIAGVTAADLANWPNRTLVPGYSNSLCLMVLVVLALVPLGGTLLWMLLGGPPPPYGPGLLWGALIAFWFVHFGATLATLNTALVVILPPAFYLVWAAKEGLHNWLFELLTVPRVQLIALALAMPVLFFIGRRLAAPDLAASPGFDALAQERPHTKLIGPVHGWHKDIGREVAASAPLVVCALLLGSLVDAGIMPDVLPIIFTLSCLVYAYARVAGVLADVHVLFCSCWFSGTTETRKGLGRKCALAILVRGLAWLPAGLVGAATLAVAEAHQRTQFDEVLLVLLPILLMVALFAGTASRLPLLRNRWTIGLFGVCTGTLLARWLVVGFELGTPGRWVLVFGLAGLALTIWIAVARSLSTAEIIT